MSSLAPQRNDALVIRRARPVDAAEIARVQVQSWRETYAGIIPQPYLDQLSVPAHERQWRQNPGQWLLGIRRRMGTQARRLCQRWALQGPARHHG